MPRRTFGSRWAQGGAQTDPGDIKVELGWIGEKPPYQYENWKSGRVDDMLAHLEEQGVANWHTDTSYLEGGLCIGSDRAIYRAVQANSGVNPTTDGGTNWVLLLREATTVDAGIVQRATDLEVSTGVVTDKFISPASLQFRNALTSRSGLVELATDAETAALADTARAVTPASLGALAASIAQRGILQLASNAEVTTGTNATKAVTPQSLTLASNIASGYYTLPGGLLVQWGTRNFLAPVDSDAGILEPFPIAFPTAVFAVFASGPLRFRSGTGADTSGAAEIEDLTQLRLWCATAANSGLTNISTDVHWLAIGN